MKKQSLPCRIFAMILIAGFVALALAGQPLTFTQQNGYKALCGSLTIEECGGVTITQALRNKECPLAPRLASFCRWLITREKHFDSCVSDLATRYESLTSSKRYAIDDKGLPPAGDSAAPVLIVVYVSANCPLCKYLTRAIHDSVTAGSLKGKAKLIAKPCAQGIGDRGQLAAGRSGRFWEFFLALAESDVRPDRPVLLRLAKSAGIPEEAFSNALDGKELLESLRASCKECGDNGVKITPTFFINGRRYRSYKDPRWVVDAALFEYDVLRGR